MKQITSVGPYGASVAILRKDAAGPFYIRWRDRETGKQVTRTTDQRVLTKAKAAALEKSLELANDQAGTPRKRSTGPTTWGGLLDWYEQTWFPLLKSASEQTFSPKVIDRWRQSLPLDDAVEEIEPAVFALYMQRRKKDGFTTSQSVTRMLTDRTVGKDLEWLRRVVNKGIESPTLKLRYNPLSKVAIPNSPVPKRPVAPVGRWEKIREQADGVGSQGLFGGFMDLLRALGWRVTAVCEIRLADVDQVHGRIRKDAAVDKEGHDGWVAVSDSLKPRLKALLTARAKLTGESPYLFPAVETPGKPWNRDYVKHRLEYAEKRAGLEPLDGGDFHPYRRLWARQLVNEPTRNVAAAGSWKSTRMVELYQGLVTDDEVKKVMNAISF